MDCECGEGKARIVVSVVETVAEGRYIMEKCKVSIVIPVYNVECYLRECLDCLIHQTLKEIEIICVDDGSDDSSGMILDEYAKWDGRITVFHKKNSNAGLARNEGLKVARGEYIMFLDSDDFFETDLLEKVYGQCVENNLDLCICNFNRFDDVSKEYSDYYQGDETIVSKIRGRVFNMAEMKDSILPLWPCVPWNKMIRRQLVLESGIVFQDIHNANDLFFSYAIMTYAKRMKYAYYEKPLVHYRINTKGQLSNCRSKSPMCIYEALQKTYRYYEEKCPEYMNVGFYECIIGHIWNSIRSVAGKVREDLVVFYRDKGLDFFRMKEAILEKEIPNYKLFYVRFIMNYDGAKDDISCLNSNFSNDVFRNVVKTEKLFDYISHLGAKVALWGAGQRGELFIEECNKQGKNLDYVIDRSVEKQGKMIGNYRICSFDECKDDFGVVLITNANFKEHIQNCLKEAKKDVVMIDAYTYYAMNLSIQESIISF